MTRAAHRLVVLVLVASGVMVAVQSPDARRQLPPPSKPGLGVSGVGTSSVFVPAPSVTNPGVMTTPGVHSPGVTNPMASGTPGVSTRTITTPAVMGTPGAPAPSIATKGVYNQPGVASRAPGVSALPRGYYTAIPATAVQKVYKGEMCYYADGVYYRPEYYLGSLVFVVVP